MDLVNDLNNRLLFAIPKKGRLAKPVLDLLDGSDFKFHRSQRLDIALVDDLPVALVFVPASEIPRLLIRGRIDLGITGRDQIAEYAFKCPKRPGVEELLELPFGACKLQVQVPHNGSITDPRQLIGKTVCTSFENLTRAYFHTLESTSDNTLSSSCVKPTPLIKVPLISPLSGGTCSSCSLFTGLKTDVERSGGSVESSIALGDADGIVDLVGERFSHVIGSESGETMRAHGLIAISTVFESKAVLIKSKRTEYDGLINLIQSRIRGVITAQKYVLCTYNIARNSVGQACKITPGKRSATINALEEDGWVAVSAMVERRCIASTMDQLEAIGAEDILVRKIENARTRD